ncbi:hypothetical protein F511_40815 [Dorcoceras hygrometricum]|uniref:Splicing factor 3B subunit 1-like n=1 Tax=Dorcoceras hygrometricum TaxID=472368 RepID=A0A2Z7A8J2_9LAMI|nr:hypothetical protein F511_40815 [Dorcoceras hygrometricum]
MEESVKEKDLEAYIDETAYSWFQLRAEEDFSSDTDFRSQLQILIAMCSRGTTGNLSFGELQLLENLSFRGNDRSEIISFPQPFLRSFNYNGCFTHSDALQVIFDSVLSLSDSGMVSMFKTLESSGLRGFLGCSADIYEGDLKNFFVNAFVRENTVIRSFQGKFVEIFEEQFAGSFFCYWRADQDFLQEEGVESRVQALERYIGEDSYSKAGSFDAVTHERFLLMTAIHGGIKIIWSRFLFDILKYMVTPSSNQSRGFSVQICVLLKGAPDLILGESNLFPHLKVLTVKTVGTYVAKNKSVSTESEEVKEKAVVEKVVKAAVQRRPVPTAEPIAKKKRTTVGRAAPKEKDLFIVPVVQDAEPISVVPARSPIVQTIKAPKRKLILQEEIDEEEQDKEEKAVKETKRRREIRRRWLTETSVSDEESMAIDEILKQIPEDMMLPYILVEEPTHIKFGRGIEIKEVDWYKATLPKVDPMDKGNVGVRRIRIPLPERCGRFKILSPGTAPGSDQFHEEIGTSTVGCVGLLIRSTTGIPIPSPVCTRRHDDDFTDGISSPKQSEQVRRRRRGEERRGRENIR